MSQLNDIIQDLQWKLGERRREFAIGASGLLVAVLVGLLIWWAFFVRWQPPPSIFDSPVQDVLGYLAMDDFSQLPMEERIQFLLEFSDRFRGMEQSDSATMAAFFAGMSQWITLNDWIDGSREKEEADIKARVEEAAVAEAEAELAAEEAAAGGGYAA